MIFPHCDQRILHAPSECQWCDEYPEWQKLREAWGIAFTGHLPGIVTEEVRLGTPLVTRTFTTTVEPGRDRGRLPCPADFNRPADTGSDHRRWAGNVATSQEPVNESAASRMLYSSPPVRRPEPSKPDPSLTEAIEEARDRPGFIERLRGSIERHRDLLDRLK